jgi:multiple sugar transport system ATP-binding protein
MARVRLDGLTKTFPKGAVALADLHLDVAHAEIMVVVGPSGCGKSTLLRLVAGLETPSAGTILIDDRVVNDDPPQVRNVAMVFQDYALYPHLTVRGNLEFPLRMRGIPRGVIAERVRRTAALLDLEALLERLPRQLSGGQRQRVAMGRALVREPSVFLLDEPLSNLDAKLRGQVRGEIEELQRRTRTTMLYVTHDQVEAMTLGHRLAVLDRGRLRQVGTPRDVYERPADTFVAGFLGSPPMNLFTATIALQADGGTLVVGDQRVPLPRLPEPMRGAASRGPLTIGVRPEALRLGTPDDARALAATTRHVEHLGHETLVYLRAGTIELTARTDGMRDWPPETPVGVSFDASALYFFDAAGAAVGAPRRTTT